MTKKRIIGLILAVSMLASLFFVMASGSAAASAGITAAQGWFESAYAEWTPVSGADGYNAYIAPAGSSSWTKIARNEHIRTIPFLLEPSYGQRQGLLLWYIS